LSIFSKGELSIRFAEDSLIAINESIFEDASLDTCTEFQRRDINNELRHTHFRIRRFNGQIGDINVTITGTKLGCGYDIYVSSLSLDQSKTWLGRWTTCTLLEISTDMGKERCSYWCMEPGYWREVQVLKVPRTTEESYWEVCYINLTVIVSGEFCITFMDLWSVSSLLFNAVFLFKAKPFIKLLTEVFALL